jgi:hypothetical protein
MTSEIVEDGRFSRPCGPGAHARAIRAKPGAAGPPSRIHPTITHILPGWFACRGEEPEVESVRQADEAVHSCKATPAGNATRPERGRRHGADPMSLPPSATSRTTASRSTGLFASSATTWLPWRTTSPLTSGGGRIRSFREELSRDRLVSFFATAEELAQKVSVAVTNQLNEQPVTRQPPVPSGRGWTIPPPVRSFTGRDDQLAALRHQLINRGVATVVPTAALTGMGGIGKT